jgi:hypothetical protein
VRHAVLSCCNCLKTSARTLKPVLRRLTKPCVG